MSMIDFQKFNETVHLADVAKALKITATRFFPTWIRSQCPICKHPDYHACKVEWEKGLWYCHRCKSGGNALKLAVRILGGNSFTAAKIVCQRLGIPVPYQARTRTRRRQRDRSGEIVGDSDEDDALG